MKRHTNFILVLVFALTLTGCEQLNSDNWQWEKPADWRLPLLSDYSAVILNYLPEGRLNIIGNTLKDLPNNEAREVLTAGLSKLTPQFIDTVFTEVTKGKISDFKSHQLISADQIGNLVNEMVGEVEKQESSKVLQDFIGVIDALINEFEDSSIAKIVGDLNNTQCDNKISDVAIDLADLLGDNSEAISSGTLFIDINENTIPFEVEYKIIFKGDNDVVIKSETLTLMPNSKTDTKSVNLSAKEILQLKSFSGNITGRVTNLTKDNLTDFITGKLVAGVRVKIETKKVLISF